MQAKYLSISLSANTPVTLPRTLQQTRKLQVPIVEVQEGVLQGKISRNFRGGTFYSFLGIPYGKPPVGDLRFKAPQPAEPWNGIFNATKQGPECPSLHLLFRYYTGNEAKCLHLNVFTRRLPEKHCPCLKPVMVWIHSCAYFFGSNKNELFGPEYLMSEDIVLVTINYRLGVLGFLCLDDPSLGVPGNAGLKDMVLALQWVQTNIKQFNGDPDNVTIFGMSSGGSSVHYLYVSPLAKGLFHKAIAQSGCSLNPWARGCSNGRIIADALGFNEIDEKKILDHLMRTPAKKLVKAQHKAPDVLNANMIRPYAPVVEKPSDNLAFLTEDPIDIIEAGTFNDVPLIMGYTSNEGIFFEGVRRIQPEAQLTSDFENEIHFDLKLPKRSEKSKEVANKIQKFYFGDDKPSLQNLEGTYLMKSDNLFAHGIHRCVKHQKVHSTAPIYLYRMSLETFINFHKTIATVKCIPLLFFFFYLAFKSGEGKTKNFFMRMSRCLPLAPIKGVCHGDDLGYLFKTFLSPQLEPWTIEETSVRRFVKLWTNFAKTGNPTPEEKDALLNNVVWKPVDNEEDHYLDLGAELKMESNPDHERMEFWDSIYEYD